MALGLGSGLLLNASSGEALDLRFKDADGDLIADLPADPKEQTDPATLIFAYTPVEDPEVYRKIWDDFVAHLAKETGRKVVFFPVQSNAAQIEAMRAGRLHIAGFNTGSVPLAVNCAGFAPFAMMASKKDEFGYEMEIIVQAAGPIQKVEDLKGKTIAFTDPNSNSGFKAPSAILKAKYGLVAERDFKPVFSGKHDNSVIGVANKDYDAAAIANAVMHRIVARGVVDGTKLRSIYKSQTFPTTGYGLAHNLKPELAAKIKQAFFNFKWEGTALAAEYVKSSPPQEKYIPIVYKDTWAVIRDIDQAIGVSYACK
ncbi:MAG: phosphate/phosphite/phosphonate ABC transporter substrate-binding protein [Acetobacteraceae bacterium]|nr:phosphate/phosphite/phosphonate ABC transporter substrate-binding protein [Acetobacteraceae bacterium]